ARAGEEHCRDGAKREGLFRPRVAGVERIPQEHLQRADRQCEQCQPADQHVFDTGEPPIDLLHDAVQAAPPARYVRPISNTAAATASAKAFVPSGPPRSAVRIFGDAITRSSAASIASAARCREGKRRRSPIQTSSIAAEPMRDDGLALSFPAMSGAEPCWAWATA